MATTTERLAILIEANASKAIAEFRQVGGAAQGLQNNLGKSGGALSTMGTQLGGLFGGGGALGAGIAAASTAATALAAFIAGGVTGFLDLAKTVDDFRRITGTSAEDASRLVAAFDDVGVEAGAAGAAIFQLEKRLGANNDLLNAYGITVARNTSGQTDMVETILRIGDAYRGTSDPIQRASILTTAFGKSGAAIAPLLERTRGTIEDMFASAEQTNQIFTSADLIAAREYREAIDDMQDSFRGLQREAGEGLVPFLTDAAGLATTLLQRISDIVKGPPADEGGFWNTLATGIHESLQAAGGLLSFLPRIGDAADSAADGMESLVEEVDDLANAVSKAVDADRSLAASQRGLEADRRSLTDAQEDYDDLLKQGAVNTDKLADAERSLAAATRSVGSAQRERTKAQDEYNDALAAFIALPTDTNADNLADAQDNLADADDNVANANDRLTESQANLAKAKAGDPDYQEKLADAKQRVADQTQRVADAEYQLGERTLASIKAHDAETEALTGKADAAERLLANYTLLIAQYPALAPVLGAQIPALTEATAPGGAGGVSAGGLFSTGTSLPYTPVAPSSAGGLLTSGSPVTNNNTFNITAPATIDPMNLSNAIVWNLN